MTNDRKGKPASETAAATAHSISPSESTDVKGTIAFAESGQGDKPVRPLAHLLGHLAESAPEKYHYAPEQNAAVLATTWPAEPPFTDYFQKTWARLGTGKKLAQIEGQVPANAGPLNTSQLIHRALVLMQEQSPQYLQHFLQYADALSWLEKVCAPSAASVKPASRTPTVRTSARKRL